MMEITVVCDSNDADYVTKVSKITSEDLEKVKPLIEAIKNFKSYKVGNWSFDHNYPCGEHYPREDLGEKFPRDIYVGIDEESFDIFENIVPDGGFHSVKSIQVTPFVEKTRLL